MANQDEYIENCRRMKNENIKKRDSVTKRAKDAYSPDTEKALYQEAASWDEWVKFWQDLENKALTEDYTAKDRHKGVENGT